MNSILFPETPYLNLRGDHNEISYLFEENGAKRMSAYSSVNIGDNSFGSETSLVFIFYSRGYG